MKYLLLMKILQVPVPCLYDTLVIISLIDVLAKHEAITWTNDD